MPPNGRHDRILDKYQRLSSDQGLKILSIFFLFDYIDGENQNQNTFTIIAQVYNEILAASKYSCNIK